MSINFGSINLDLAKIKNSRINKNFDSHVRVKLECQLTLIYLDVMLNEVIFCFLCLTV